MTTYLTVITLTYSTVIDFHMVDFKKTTALDKNNFVFTPGYF